MGYIFDANVVLDNVTGLTWQRVVPPTSYTWADAKIYCAGLSLAGSAPWRLPTVVELESILDLTSGPSINPTAFPTTPTAGFWSASPLAYNGSFAWSVNFNYGGTSGSSLVSNSYLVRCVR